MTDAAFAANFRSLPRTAGNSKFTQARLTVIVEDPPGISFIRPIYARVRVPVGAIEIEIGIPGKPRLIDRDNRRNRRPMSSVARAVPRGLTDESVGSGSVRARRF